MRILDTTNAFTTCKKRIKNVFSPGPVIHHSKVERHRGNIVMPPSCIHTADIRPLQSTTLQAPHCRAPSCRAPHSAGTTLHWHCSVASLIVKVWPSRAVADCRRAAAAAAGSLLALINGNPFILETDYIQGTYSSS